MVTLRTAMFCPKCGAENADTAGFCQKCGNALQTTSAGSTPSSSYSPTPTTRSSKSPIVAAILNLFFGVGYLYLGYKKVLGIQTIIFVILMLIVYVIVGTFTLGIVSLVIAIVLAIDGYQKGQGQKGFISAEM
jgi:uncharacterized membrane protein YvbJ